MNDKREDYLCWLLEFQEPEDGEIIHSYPIGFLHIAKKYVREHFNDLYRINHDILHGENFRVACRRVSDGKERRYDMYTSPCVNLVSAWDPDSGNEVVFKDRWYEND